MLIRKMTREDVPACAAIEKRSITPPWSERDFLDTMEQDTLMMVAEDEDQVRGYINMYLSFGEGEITNVAVDPDFRGRGIAARMMEAFIGEAKSLQVERIVLEVRAGNDPAIGLYRKMGFVPLGIRKNFYEHPAEDALIMELTIC